MSDVPGVFTCTYVVNRINTYWDMDGIISLTIVERRSNSNYYDIFVGRIAVVFLHLLTRLLSSLPLPF